MFVHLPLAAMAPSPALLSTNVWTAPLLRLLSVKSSGVAKSSGEQKEQRRRSPLMLFDACSEVTAMAVQWRKNGVRGSWLAGQIKR